MNCPKCQSDIVEGGRFCPSCRVDLDKLRAIGALAPLAVDARGIDVLEESAGPGWNFVYAARVALADFLKLIAVGSLAVAVVLGLVAKESAEYRLVLVGVAAGLLVVAVLVGLRAFRRRTELLPAVAPPGALSELNDVQFMWVAPTGVQERGRVLWLQVHLQNCVNRPRAVTLRFGCESGAKSADPAAAMRFARRIEGMLGPGETVEVRVPVVINPAPPKTIELWLSPSVTGDLARRVRYATASQFVERITTEETVVGAALTLMVTGTALISAGGGLPTHRRCDCSCAFAPPSQGSLPVRRARL